MTAFEILPAWSLYHIVLQLATTRCVIVYARGIKLMIVVLTVVTGLELAPNLNVILCIE
jgi:hypothetical protein